MSTAKTPLAQRVIRAAETHGGWGFPACLAGAAGAYLFWGRSLPFSLLLLGTAVVGLFAAVIALASSVEAKGLAGAAKDVAGAVRKPVEGLIEAAGHVGEFTEAVFAPQTPGDDARRAADKAVADAILAAAGTARPDTSSCRPAGGDAVWAAVEAEQTAAKPRRSRARAKAPRKPRPIRTKVVGVTFANPDGGDRQSIIQRHCRPGDELMLRREPDNPRDELAIGVWARTAGGWRQIGYIRSELAETVHEIYDSGRGVKARILDVTGGVRPENYGVNIEIYTD